MVELLVPVILFLGTVVAALRLPAWRTGAGPVLELVALAGLLEMQARGVVPQQLLPARCAAALFVTYVLLRTHRALAGGPGEAVGSAVPEARSASPGWKSFLIAQTRFDRTAVSSSLHLLPFAAVVLLPALLTGKYVAAEAEIGMGLLFGLLTLAAHRAGIVILIVYLSAGFLGALQQARAGTLGDSAHSASIETTKLA
jgi:hypothetical protein